MIINHDDQLLLSWWAWQWLWPRFEGYWCPGAGWSSQSSSSGKPENVKIYTFFYTSGKPENATLYRSDKTDNSILDRYMSGRPDNGTDICLQIAGD